jgi:hypothetical protein
LCISASGPVARFPMWGMLAPMADRKRYKNRVGIEVDYEQLTESEQDWYSLSNPQVSLEEWCQNADPEPDDTARWPISSS